MLTLRYYQKNAIDAIYNYYAGFNPNAGNCVVAMPTGTGKSLVIGGFAYDVMTRYHNQRIVMATHVKELIVQNAAKVEEIWPGAPIGVYSAGLKAKDVSQPLIYGGIASMVNNVAAFGHRDLLLVDECHLIGKAESAQYQTFIKGLKVINPWLKVIGFTATPYRMGMGLITNGDIFKDIVYDITGFEAFNQLIAEGWLSMLIPLSTEVGIDMTGVHTSSTGDYVQGEAQDRAMRVSWDALNVAARYRHNRFSWLLFAAGVEHCYQIQGMLTQLGITSCVVHSNSKQFPISDAERDQRIADFKLGKYQCIINYGVLTTGFDHPPIDLIIILRATKSVPLWVQMLGRGTRPFHGSFMFPPKHNCLVLDFARNTAKLGPINDPVIPKIKGQGAGDAPVKICDHCGTFNHISAKWCIGCGEEFHFQVKTTAAASTAALIKANDVVQEPIYERLTVKRQFFRRHHSKRSGLDTLNCVYSVEERIEPYNDYVAIESVGQQRSKAENWWSQRSVNACPPTIELALGHAQYLRTPSYITVWSNPPNGYPEIVRYEYD